jgi:signal transduction histidine kinase
LAIVKHLCEVLSGTVALVSTSEGTTFTIDLPVQVSDDASALRLRALGRA